ncbi:putative V-type proton ATPase subunit H [Paratrimastix pyriformis]|uniref:V-type proton ATPase subunit H n=1 Tax=Paratrimastix pyriformis TaxID=342808 RepID=A0ABQ8UIR4_9EUKA|nr:putative V-type proton ATPase subunit H [Paratrimastix pyriformis]|eukprot:GAFH01001575.1.p1 GENE.GAFH01001575.1~~GAFH01001575.1.p1  ORF type:complete len:479 (-),score=215.20 GAFH01001575.1:78-1514(-)
MSQAPEKQATPAPAPTPDNSQEAQDAAVLATRVDWQAQLQANVLTQREYDFIVRFASLDFNTGGEQIFEVLLSALSKTTALEPLSYLLLMIDNTLKAHPEGIEMIHTIARRSPRDNSPFTIFLRLLNRTDPYIRSKALHILCSLLGALNDVQGEVVDAFYQSIYANLRRPEDAEGLNVAVSALQIVLRKQNLRLKFFHEHGLDLLLPLVASKAANVQLLYQVIFCVWLMSFNHVEIIPGLLQANIIPLLIQVLKTQLKEKVIRVTLAILKNMSGVEAACTQMIDQGLVKVLHNLMVQKWSDEDLQSDLEDLVEILNGRVAALISIDVYSQELEKGQLTWTPVHKSDKFWKDNYTKFDVDNFRLLRTLGALLYTEHPRTLAVTCHDLGNFARFHPRGKTLLEEFGLKAKILELLGHQDAEVQKEALLCVQKMLVQKWENLSGGLSNLGGAPSPNPAGRAAAMMSPLNKEIPQMPPAPKH